MYLGREFSVVNYELKKYICCTKSMLRTYIPRHRWNLSCGLIHTPINPEWYPFNLGNAFCLEARCWLLCPNVIFISRCLRRKASQTCEHRRGFNWVLWFFCNYTILLFNSIRVLLYYTVIKHSNWLKLVTFNQSALIQLRVTMLCWNNGFWLDVVSHMTCFNQSECFISAEGNYGMLK